LFKKSNVKIVKTVQTIETRTSISLKDFNIWNKVTINEKRLV